MRSTWFKRGALLVALLVAFVVAGCQQAQTPPPAQPTAPPPKATPAPPKPAAPEQPKTQPVKEQGKVTESEAVQAARKLGTSADKPVVKTASGLQYIDVKEGNGEAAKAGEMAKVHYTGWLVDGTKFDSSLDRGQPFAFQLGAGQVIRGWDEGVAGMKPGGVRKLIIPFDLAYGLGGRPPVIPPSATLIFEVIYIGKA